MSRFLLALSLFLCTAAALAGSTSTASCSAADSGAKPAKSTTVVSAQDCDAITPTSQPAAAPARSSTPRTSLPRWHSLLPGMIR